MKELEKSLQELKLPYEPQMLAQFAAYMDGVLAWNQKVNLTRITERDEFIIKHFIDSVICCGFEECKQAKEIVDVGTGGGFPGVPLAILSPDKHYTLIDSLQKRLRIIDTLCAQAGITNVTTLHGRAEDLAADSRYRQQFDLCVSRAVANTAVLAEYCLPFIRLGGSLLAYKGPDAAAEAKEAEKAIRLLGGSLTEIRSCGLTAYGLDHNILIIKKIKDTPPKYPRKAGTPSKEPLK